MNEDELNEILQDVCEAAVFIDEKMKQIGFNNYIIGPICSSTFAHNYYKQEKIKENPHGNN